MKLKQILVALMLLTGVVSYAHDFEYKIPGQDNVLSMLYFKILDENDRTVELTYQGKINPKLGYSFLPDELVIPLQVRHNNKMYTVVKIGKKAFANCVNIKKVTIPATVTEIGNFAFEGCVYLKTVIFPSNNVKIGTGAFYKCEEIENLEFGNNWNSIDFSHFRFSKKLKVVNIPGSVNEITGLSDLMYLQSIYVDNLNTTYMTDNGLLYINEGQTLVFCPRNYAPEITVREGCVEVEEHALERCRNTKSITLPKSLKTISFRETYRMKYLKTINMKNPQPIHTAFEMKGNENIGCWFFILPNSDIIINVPKDKVENQKSINLYKEALPPHNNGEFLSPFEDNTIPYVVKASEIPTEKNLKEYDFNNEK